MLQLKGHSLRKIIHFPLLFLIIITFGFISAAIILDKTINKESIVQAENIIGLNFNDAKRDSLIQTLNAHLKNYQYIRESFDIFFRCFFPPKFVWIITISYNPVIRW